ncbi:MAG: class I SAM-dependent rRNA methyltransferase [Eubacterium sp.]|nr:class I SAM-dependent rRNA methyltransferase [Eubacterium sp.]
MSEATVILKKGEGRTIKAGGAWIYDNEIDRIERPSEAGTAGARHVINISDVTPGSMVAVEDFDGYPMGRGFINPKSKITIRMMTRDPEKIIDDTFLRNRVEAAWNYRKAVTDTSSCRVIFGEADFLPGLVVDKYEDVLVVESLALGIDLLKQKILEFLTEALAKDGIRIRAIFERSDAKIREKEGLPRAKGLIWMAKEGDRFADGWIRDERSSGKTEPGNSGISGNAPEGFDPRLQIVENGVKYMVDVENGQKTGFFLDQKGNRMAMQNLIRRMKESGETVRVLDCFTHTGSFALNCGLGGADSVLGIDVSDLAVAQATENAALNGLTDRVTFQAADVLDLLPKLNAEGEKYDVVILDPPAFTKTRDKIRQAAKGYREINIQGMKLVKNGGYLATCSCSHFMDYETFTAVIGQAARAAHRRLRQVEYRTQAADHPILWSGDEASYYLKFYIFQVLEER